MKLYAILRQSVAALAANKGRSLLTVLGIVIGIGSVIALVSLGAGVRGSISEQLSALGTTNLMIVPGAVSGFRTGGPGVHGGIGGFQVPSSLTEEDLAALSDRPGHPQIELVSGQVSGSAVFNTLHGDRRYSVLGTSETYFAIQHLSATSGGLYGGDEVEGRARVVVLGAGLAADLYGDDDPVGLALEIAGKEYRVIGVLEAAPESRLFDPGRQAYVPYTTSWDDFGTRNFDALWVHVATEDAVEAVRHDIRTTLLAAHGIDDPRLADFIVTSSADLLSIAATVTGTLTSLLAAIAAISLLVGGIGIMNIMLVSVTERTREIGLRKAVGASEGDILLQFVVEAVLLTLSGGILGIGLGSLIGRIGAVLIGLKPTITGGSVALAVGVSSLVGLVFGVYPAAKAAALDPIDALRYE